MAVRQTQMKREDQQKTSYGNEDSEQPSHTPVKAGVQTACPGPGYMLRKGRGGPRSVLETGGDGKIESCKQLA